MQNTTNINIYFHKHHHKSLLKFIEVLPHIVDYTLLNIVLSCVLFISSQLPMA